MASASSLARWNTSQHRDDGALETIEIDPQFASALGFVEGSTVRTSFLAVYSSSFHVLVVD
jgi:hypothetical protein